MQPTSLDVAFKIPTGQLGGLTWNQSLGQLLPASPARALWQLPWLTSSVVLFLGANPRGIPWNPSKKLVSISSHLLQN